MIWGWNSGERRTWPAYEAGYLATALGGSVNGTQGSQEKEVSKAPYAYKGLDGEEKEEQKQVYFDNISKNYEADADECLKQEFAMWLEGRHQDNRDPQTYNNERTGVQTRLAPNGEKLDDWVPTWWGTSQLTHLDGVRPFLRDMEQRRMQKQFEDNLLAEYGPQNIEQAWQYFKTWVKGHKSGPDVCMVTKTPDDDGDHEPTRSLGYSMQFDRDRYLFVPGASPELKTARDIVQADVKTARDIVQADEVGDETPPTPKATPKPRRSARLYTQSAVSKRAR